MPTKRASCGLLYGAMNSLKTTNLGRIARYLHETWGLTCRLISADNEWDSLADEIADGIVEPLSIVSFPNPFPSLTKLTKGMWPAGEWKGGAARLDFKPTPLDKLQKLCYLIEGTTTIGELLMQDHTSKARVIGQDVVGKFEEAVNPGEEAYTYANPAQSHHYNVQTFVTQSLIPDFMALPIRWVWWSGHEYKGEDEATKQRMLGPGVTGKAATTKVPRKVGNCIHMDMSELNQLNPATKRNERSLEHRAYYEPHADMDSPTLRWPAGLKMPAAWVPVWRERHPGGFMELTLTAGVEDYLRFHDEMTAKSAAVTVGQAGVATDGGAVDRGGVASGEVSTPAAILVKPEPLWKQRLNK